MVRLNELWSILCCCVPTPVVLQCDTLPPRPSQTLSLAPIFLVSCGGVLQTDGVYLYKYYHHHSVDYEDHIPIEFSGALMAAVLYVS